ncbi:MAG TPA: septum site-determining protein MinC [Pseudogracilibacillus sp.]|nr:septum site-determining protein MinC [Pseudogracilibacillus sp.]
MTEENNQLVIIKGTKEGLIFHLHDDCSFRSLIEELTLKLNEQYPNADAERKVDVVVKLGHRYLTEERKRAMQQLIEKDKRFRLVRYEAEVIDKKTATEWLEETEVKRVKQIVRSGQVVQVKGDLLLIGDVNPGGQVRATGNIYILGKLSGIAHAGIDGDEQAVIVASYMDPMQLRIANYISRSPDYETEGLYMECGYLDKESDKIIIDRLQVLPYIRKRFQEVERRINK